MPSLAAPFATLFRRRAVAGEDPVGPAAPEWLSRSALATSGAALAIMILTGWHFMEIRKNPSWREAAAFVSAGAKPGDAVVYNAHMGQFALERYLNGAAAGLSAYGLPSDWYDGKTPTVGKWVRSDADLERLREASASHDVIWFVRSHTAVHDNEELGRKWCMANLEKTESHKVAFIEVIRFETPGVGVRGDPAVEMEGTS